MNIPGSNEGFTFTVNGAGLPEVSGPLSFLGATSVSPFASTIRVTPTDWTMTHFSGSEPLTYSGTNAIVTLREVRPEEIASPGTLGLTLLATVGLMWHRRKF